MSDREMRRQERDQRRQQRHEQREQRRAARYGGRGGITAGIILISLGVLLLINNIAPGLSFDRLWPVLIIVWGIGVFISGLFPPLNTSRMFSGVFIGLIGVIFLYNTLGLLPYGFWFNLIDLWPVFLIALGFSIIAGIFHSRILSVVPALIILAALIAAVYYQGSLYKSQGVGNATLHGGSAAGITSGSATVGFAVGKLAVGPSNNLYDIKTKNSGGLKPAADVEKNGSKITLTIRPQRNNPIPLGNNRRQWDVLLSRDVEWRLDMSGGVSDATYNLSDLNVRDFHLNGGVGDTTARFGDKAKNLTGSIDTGVSNVRLFVPKSSGVRLAVNRGLSSFGVTNLKLNQSQQGNTSVYETPGYKSAKKKIDLDINIGISSVNVEGY